MSQEKSMMSGVAHVQTILIDLLELIAKASKSKMEVEHENKLRDEICNLEETSANRITGAQLYSLQSSINGKVIKELKEREIPYACFNVENTTKSCILIPAKRQAEVNAIISSVRIQLGLTLDNKEELDAALLLKSKNLHPSEQEISNLTGNMAQKVKEYADKYKVTAVVEKKENGTYSVYCAKEDGPKMNKFLFEAAWDLTGAGANSENKRMEYARTEEEEIENALKRASEKMSDSYIFSATQPDCYLHIEPEGFTFYRNGVPTITEIKENNPTEYEEYLKLQIKSIDAPVYILREEVAEKGGPLSLEIREEVKNSLFLREMKMENLEEVAAEKELRKFLEEKYAISSAKSIEEASTDMRYESLNDFITHMRNKINEDPDRSDYYEKVIRLCSNGEMHMTDAAVLLERTEIKEIYIEHNPIASIEQYVENANKEMERQAYNRSQNIQKGI